LLKNGGGVVRKGKDANVSLEVKEISYSIRRVKHADDPARASILKRGF